MKQKLSFVEMMAVMLSSPVGQDPFSKSAPRIRFQKQDKPGADKKRKSKRRISNHNRKINQAYASR